MQVDASDIAMGAVLLQRDKNSHLQLCAYLSKKNSDAECNWLAWEKEVMSDRLQFINNPNIIES